MLNELRRIARRVAIAIGRGRVQLVDDSGPVQLVQLKLNELEILDKIRRLAEFGFSSAPPANGDAIALFIGGDRSNGVIIATGDQATRPKNLQAGETIVYDAFGKSIKFAANGDITVECNGHKLIVNGDVQVTGKITATDEITAKNTHTVSAHTHSDPQGGSTFAPTG